MIRRELEGKARVLREQGKTFKDIAAELDINEKTARRWLVTTPKRRVEAEIPPPDWPADRLWPNWTPADLKARVDWPQELAESTIGLIHMAQELGNLFVPWFFKSIVEVGERYDVSYDDRGPREPWLLALAGLPVLAVWLDASECSDLATLVEQHRPWEGRGLLRQNEARRTYAHLAKPLVARVKQRALTIGAYLSMTQAAKEGNVGQTQLVILLNALMQRVPRFDTTPRFSLYRRFNLGQLFLGIFQYPKGGVQK